jgi:hypothetical protein
VIRAARCTDGTWSHAAPYSGKTWFALEGPGPSRWATVRANRVLRWWELEH